MKIKCARGAATIDGALFRNDLYAVQAVEPGCIVVIRGSRTHDAPFVALQMTSATASDGEGHIRKINIGYIR